MSTPSAVARLRPALIPTVSTLAVSLLVLAGPTSEARADATPPPTPTSTLTLTVPSSVTAGKAFTVSGRLTSTSASTPTSTGSTVKPAAIPTASVVLRWRSVGVSRWTGSRVVTTNAQGAWSTSLAFGVNNQLRADYAGSTTAAASRTAPSAIVARQSLKITQLSPSRPAVGQRLAVIGTTSKALRGTKVTLQRLNGKTWKTVSTATVNKAGGYSAKISISSSAALSLRTRSVSTPTLTQAYSSRRAVSVAVTATLYPGQVFAARRVLTSPNGLFTATVQTDGNLVVRDSTGAQTWATGTAGSSPTLTLTPAGNVVLGGGAGTLWSSRTKGAAPRLVLQNDGNLVLWSKGVSRWSSMTGPSTTVQPAACWSTSFDCISYTGYNASTSYWRMYAGHNCTNYVAYRMIMKGITVPPWGLPGGSAWTWRSHAAKAGIVVDTTPAVGAVMQWNRNSAGGGSSGHVVYVEQVTKTGVVISEDSWSGHASVRTILTTSKAFTSARFLHIADTI